MNLHTPMRRVVAVVLLALLPGLTGGCETLTGILDAAPKPTASVTGVSLQSLSVDGVDLVFVVRIDNPYSAPLPLVDVSYALASRGASFLDGQAAITGSIPANGSKTVEVPARLSFANLLSSLQQVRPGAVVPYTADLGLSVDAPGVGRLSLPLRKQGELPVPAVPELSLASVNFGELSLQKATATLVVRMKNTNSFPLDLNEIAYDLSLAGTSVGDAKLARAASLDPGGESTLELPLTIQPIKLGLGALDLLRGAGGNYQLTGAINASTPFGPINLPLNSTGQTAFKR